MSQFASTELAPDDWMVAVAPGNVHTMSIDQLDAAFQAGQISEQTMVWTHGMEAWLPLEEVLGGGSDASDELPAAAAWPEQVAAQPVAHQPMIAAQPLIAAQPVVQQPMFAAQPVAHQPMIAAQPMFAAQPLIAAQPMRPQQALSSGPAYPAVSPSLVPAALPSALSTAPVAMNLNLESLDLDAPTFGKKKSKLGLFAAAAVVLGGIGFTVANAGGHTEAPAAAAAAHVAEGDKPLAVGEVKADPNAPIVAKGGYNVTEAEAKAFAKEEAANKEAAALKEKELQEKATEALSGKPGAKPVKGAGKAAAEAMKAKFSGGGGKKGSKKAGGGGALKSGGSTFDPLNGSLP